MLSLVAREKAREMNEKHSVLWTLKDDACSDTKYARARAPYG